MLSGLGIVVACYFRNMLKPSFPEILDKQNPLWERIAACLVAVTAMVTYVSHWQLAHARTTAYCVQVGILVLFYINSDARFVRRCGRNQRGT
jgi:hypothetical protein